MLYDELFNLDQCRLNMWNDWLKEYDIRIEKKNMLYIAYSNINDRIIFYSSDPIVVYNAILYLGEKE